MSDTPAPQNPVHPYYVVHAFAFTLPNGDSFSRGDVMRGADALAFELAVASGATDPNNATPAATDPGA